MPSTARIPLSASEKQQWLNAVGTVSSNLSSAHEWAYPTAHSRVYVVSFDGTTNDRNNVPHGEASTNPAQIEKNLSQHYNGKLAGAYYAGVGSYGDALQRKVDAATGHGAGELSEKAYGDFTKAANDWLAADPHADIKVVAIGFSRGAAEARNFLNMVDERGVEHAPPGSAMGKPHSVHSSAILYDTVTTGQTQLLKQGIPTSTDYVVHLTAKDESRLAFPLTSIKDSTQDARTHMELALAGAHSDIGGGYQEGPDKMAKFIGDVALSRLGLPVTPGNVPVAALDEGRHDSSWILEKMTPIDEVVNAAGRREVSTAPNPLKEEVESTVNEVIDGGIKTKGVMLEFADAVKKDAAAVESWFIDIVNDGRCLVMHTNCSDVHVNLNQGEIHLNGIPIKLEAQDLKAINEGPGLSVQAPMADFPVRAPAPVLATADTAMDSSR